MNSGDQLTGAARAFHKLSQDEINAMPLRQYAGKVQIVKTLKELRSILPELRKTKIMGFDTETRPSFRKGHVNPPALIQLATENAVYLIQLRWYQFGKECADILAEPSIIKAGVAIGGDMAALATLFPFQAAGCVDLGQAAEINGIPNHGLRNLTAALFGWRISKGCRCSNWEAAILSGRQIAYAATDAWLGRMIYLQMRSLGMKGLEPVR